MDAHKRHGSGKSAQPSQEVSPHTAETVRRTRGSAPPSGSHAARKANGHANGSANHAAEADKPAPETRRHGSRVNGHGQAFSSDRLEAGSNDASGPTVAIAPASAGAGTDRDACAALAHSPNGKKRHSSCASRNEEAPRVPSEVVTGEVAPSGLANDRKVAVESGARERSPGEGPLPEDPSAFVEEIHSRIDLFEIWQELLKSKDEKIKQRAVEKLTEMRYKGAQLLAEEPQQIVIDIDSAVARRAAQGAAQ